MMNGLMMHCNLNITSIMQHALMVSAHQEIVTLKSDGVTKHRYTYKDAFARVAQFANVMAQLNVSDHAKVATMAWNTYQHFELHYAIPCTGRIYHTVNPKLAAEQIAHIICNAQDEMLLLEPDCIEVIESIYEEIKHVVRYFVVLGDVNPDLSAKFNFMFYEDLIQNQPQQYDWPEIHEDRASGLCYTSGTTGNPKGVLYSHRSTVLHALVLSMSDVVGLSHQSCMMPLVPLYHISAWGMPFNAVLCGAKLVWPNAFAGKIDKIFELVQSEKVDISIAVPTVWTAYKNYLHEHHISHTFLKRAISGGSAAPYALIEAMQNYGVALENGWGMTETSALATCNRLNQIKEKPETQSIKCGKPIFGFQMRLKGPNGELLPHDGKHEGVLEVKGHSITYQYINAKDNIGKAHTEQQNQWFDTGDIACIDEYGYMHITDRAKDMIKSGGEWISSVEVENAAMGYDKVVEAAVIAANHPKWGERPLLILVPKSSKETIKHEEIVIYLSSKLHKWAIPSATILVDEIPHTATGKISKKTLREQYQDYFMHS
ncbi:long-chain-fatty-acid--CoA ligase [Acinetobacter rongchengensis]|uniref:Long-chain-fatty-acid--CoA ligase n=1 Tax=Acinetobacter rongchengensis TaxID=2419601 RepID=A0A3A8F8C7_9GAMM|nr:long-chain-fatty-acid--CoA ligase [Acinetobacter rongchengensis]RKG37431.1 long-chain-fatty-acid--CoA ligase [Acinetobacter rongchengensis]